MNQEERRVKRVKVWKRLGAAVLSLMLTAGMVPSLAVTARAASNENLALGKTATASSSYPDRVWTPDKAVDGDTSGSDSRWSSKRATGTTNDDNTDKGTKEQWLLVDLGVETPVEQVDIYWEAAFATKYEIQFSVDGDTFETAEECTASEAGKQTWRDLGIENARYIRIDCQEPKTANYGYSIYELEVYAQNKMESAEDVLASLNGEAPQISEDGSSLILPEVPQGYEISLFGSDNQQVVKLDGTIVKPLVDMDVNLLYKVVNTEDETDVAESEADIKITVPGQYQTVETDNAKPNVLPGLREWKGGSGVYTRTEDSRIVVADASMDGAAQVIKTYFDQMLGIDIPVVNGTEPARGDIYLQAGGSADELGEEGYLLTISDYVTILSPTVTGMTYGGASITQILYQDEGMDNAPKGTARDYPKYEVRAGMIDVGRMYIPLEYLEEMTVYMSWFKMNETHVHINDYWSGSGYSAFRLESEVYPEIVADDGYYTKDEYRQYQKDMKKYGLDVITEIDTPYHSECFRDVEGVQMLKTGYLDITTDEAREANQKIIENLIDEYLDGSDPVIQSEYFHIGTDEYDKQYGEQMRKWTDHFINYVNEKGYQTRLWASLGKNGFNGSTPVSNDAVMNLWAPYWADVHEMYDAGYDIINTYGGWLYIVPSGNAGYPDRLDVEKLYNNFEVNNFKSGRNPLGETIMPVAHPQTKGAEFCLWNDMTSFKTGFSWFDVYDRFKEGVALVAEKTWFGEKQDDQTYEEFEQRVSALEGKVPNANPGRVVDSEGDCVASYSFTEDGSDSTVNGYDASFTDAKVENGAAAVSEGGYITLPFSSIGYPYTVSVKMNLEAISENTVLFSGNDGTVYANIDGTGSLGFKRGAYRFSFDYEMPENEWVTLTFVCDQKNTTLYVNGESMGTAKLMDSTIGGKTQQSSTMIMTFEKILGSAAGKIDDLEVYNYAMTEEEVGGILHIASRDNLALNKDVEVSSLEVSDGRFTADLAVDGIVSSTSRVSFGKTADEQWLLVDLGSVKTISDFVLNYESQVPKYQIQVSEDGEEYTDVYSFEDQSFASHSGAAPGVQKVSVDPVNARYVKYVQLQRWKNTGNGQSYSGSLYEFEVYAAPNAELREYAQAAMDELSQYEGGSHNGNVDESFYNSLKTMLEDCLAMTADGEEQISVSDMLQYKQNILDQQAEIENHVLTVPQDAVDAYNKAAALPAENYTAESYQEFRDKLAQISLDGLDTPEAVDAVIEAVNAATEVLVPADDTEDPSTPVSKKNLEYFLNQAKGYVEDVTVSGLVESIQQLFTDAIAKGEAVMADEDATREEVLDAAEDLMLAIHALNMKAADKTDLQMALELTELIDLSKYVEAGQAEYLAAKEAAEAVMADGDAMQAETDEAWSRLVETMEALRLKADKSVLQDLISQMEGLDLSGYTEESVTMFRAALASANSIFMDETLSVDEQAKVDEAVIALQAAYDGLMKAQGGGTETPGGDTDDPQNPGGSDTDDPQTPDGDSQSGDQQTAGGSDSGAQGSTTAGQAQKTGSGAVQTGDGTPFSAMSGLVVSVLCAGTAAGMLVRRKGKR